MAGAGGGVGSLLGGWLAGASGFLVTFGVAGGLVVTSVAIVVLVVAADGDGVATE